MNQGPSLKEELQPLPAQEFEVCSREPHLFQRTEQKEMQTLRGKNSERRRKKHSVIIKSKLNLFQRKKKRCHSQSATFAHSIEIN